MVMSLHAGSVRVVESPGGERQLPVGALLV